MNKNRRVLFLVRIAVLIAIMLVMDITGIGYIKTAGLELTIMPVPVLIGAIVMGPLAGAILGGVFGLTSFFQCFGKSLFGMTLLGINPWYTAIVCIPTRILMGYLCGLIFKKLSERKAPAADGLLPEKESTHVKDLYPYGIAGISGAIMNTLFFMTTLMLLFGRTEYIRGLMGNKNVLAFVIGFIGTQGVIEAIVCFLCGTVIARAIYPIVNKNK